MLLHQPTLVKNKEVMWHCFVVMSNNDPLLALCVSLSIESVLSDRPKGWVRQWSYRNSVLGKEMTEDTRLVSESFHSCPQKYALAHSNFVLAYAEENNCVFFKTVGLKCGKAVIGLCVYLPSRGSKGGFFQMFEKMSHFLHCLSIDLHWKSQKSTGIFFHFENETLDSLVFSPDSTDSA